MQLIDLMLDFRASFDKYFGALYANLQIFDTSIPN